jgi:hypothetical protein
VQIEPQEFLELVESAGKLVCFDIESSGLKGDYNSAICVSLKPYGKEPYTLAIKQPGNDQKVVNDAKRELEKYMVWVTYYGKGFDVKFLNTRLLKWGSKPIEKRLHLDLFFLNKANLLTGHYSQAHLLGWLGTPEQKMSVSASTWSEMPFKMHEHLPTMIERCESDVRGLECMYDRVKHIVREIKR